MGHLVAGTPTYSDKHAAVQKASQSGDMLHDDSPTPAASCPIMSCCWKGLAGTVSGHQNGAEHHEYRRPWASSGPGWSWWCSSQKGVTGAWVIGALRSAAGKSTGT